MPALLPDTSLDTYISDPTNGRGFAQFMPAESDWSDELQIDKVVTFDCAPDILRQAEAAPDASLLIQGGPGAGKSHLARDVLSVAMLERRPTALWKLHVAAGKLAVFPETVEQVVTPLLERAEEQPVLILDNIDFLAYKSSATSHTKLKRRLDLFEPLIKGVVERDDLTVVGVGHTPTWRDYNWRAANETAQVRAQGVVDTFQSSVDFTGQIGHQNAIRHMTRQGLSFVGAKMIVGSIEEVLEGQLLFRYVHHAPRYLSGLRVPTVRAMRNVLQRIDEDTARLESHT